MPEYTPDPAPRQTALDQRLADGAARLANCVAHLRALYPDPSEFGEIRAPKTPTRKGADYRRTASLNFSASRLEEAARAAIDLDGARDPDGIYVTLNPTMPDVFARTGGKLKFSVTETTQDAEILARRWLLIDLDPVRPAGTSSTDAEIGAARLLADRIAAELGADGWPEPFRLLSGNGWHLVYRVDLPNDDAARDLVRDVLIGLGSRFDTPQVKVDRSVFNAARITKLAGTRSRKGADYPGDGSAAPARPHRVAVFYPPAAPVQVVARALLEAVAAAAPKQTQTTRAARGMGKPAVAGGASLVDRARAYLVRLPDAISGAGGHRATYEAACCLWRFALQEADAWALLQEYNATRTGGEPWTDSELRHKLESARATVEAAGELGCLAHAQAQAAAGAPVYVGADYAILPAPTTEQAAGDAPRPAPCGYFVSENGGLGIGESDDDCERLLCNFSARITAELVLDDGAEASRAFEITAEVGGRRLTFTLPAREFAAMRWVHERLGSGAVIFPGVRSEEHVRAAIQLLSGAVKERTRYLHTGWRHVAGDWVFLHAAGAIGAEGARDDIEVGLNAPLDRYALPALPEGTELREAVRASIYDLVALGPPALGFALLAATYRAPLGACDVVLALIGPTGAGKTEVAARVLQHFGATMDARHQPGSWSSTANSLEGAAFLLKDVPFHVDDFSPSGSAADIQRYHSAAERLIRAAGNHSGRQRCSSDASLRPVKAPRCLLCVTGEDLPRGHSVRARALILEVSPGDVEFHRLSTIQQRGAAGAYAAAMSAYLRWLASDYAAISGRLRAQVATIRDALAGSGQHRRTPSNAAELLVGVRYALDFALSCGAVDASEAKNLYDRAWTALRDLAEKQAGHHTGANPVNRFLALLNSAIASGTAHLADPAGNAPVSPERWGWRLATYGTGPAERRTWEPQGVRVGWVDESGNIYLEPDASYQAAQRMGSGDGIAVSSGILRRRLKEAGLLITEPSRETNLFRVAIEGEPRRAVLYLRPGALTGEPAGADGQVLPSDGQVLKLKPDHEKPHLEPQERGFGQVGQVLQYIPSHISAHDVRVRRNGAHDGHAQKDRPLYLRKPDQPDQTDPIAPGAIENPVFEAMDWSGCVRPAEKPDQKPDQAPAPKIPPGWTRETWTAELNRLADACRELHPARAAELEAQAAALTEATEVFA